MYCPNCKALISDSAKFCPFCGAQVVVSFNPYAPQQNHFVPQQNGGVNNPPQNVNNGKQKKPKKPKKPLSKGVKISIIVVLIVAILAGNVTFFVSRGSSTAPFVEASAQGDSEIKFDKGVAFADVDAKVEKGFQNLYYDSKNHAYTLEYSNMPQFFSNLKEGDLFVVNSNQKAKIDCFKLGFSGKIIEKSTNKVVFSVPKFAQIFDKVKINPSANNIESVSFVPNEKYNVDIDLVPSPMSADVAGGSFNFDNKITFGDYTISPKFYYKSTNKTSQLKDYQLLAKQIKIGFGVKHKESNGDFSSISGSTTIDYPAIKSNVFFDESNNIQDYDIGVIFKQSTNIKFNGGAELALKDPSDLFDCRSIFEDTSDLEKGRIVLATAYVNYLVPISLSLGKNPLQLVSVGIPFQLVLLANGKIEFECAAQCSSFNQIEVDSNGYNKSLIKNINYPNPVLGEEMDDDKYNQIDIKATGKGTLDLNIAVGVDVGISIYGVMPLKFSNDILAFQYVTSAETSSADNYDIVKDGKSSETPKVEFSMTKSQSRLLVDFGVRISKKINKDKLKIDIGGFGYKTTLFTKVWEQFPEPKDFCHSECNFGGIQLGNSYTEEEMDEAYKEFNKSKNGKALSGELKQKALDAALENVEYSVHSSFESFAESFQIPGASKYNLRAYADGAFYLTDGDRVKAQIILGEKIYNNSNISMKSNSNYFKQIYSEPNKERYVKISIDPILQLVIDIIGDDRIFDLDGTELTGYTYKSKDSDDVMMVCFDSQGKVIYIVTYENN